MGRFQRKPVHVVARFGGLTGNLSRTAYTQVRLSRLAVAGNEDSTRSCKRKCAESLQPPN